MISSTVIWRYTKNAQLLIWNERLSSFRSTVLSENEMISVYSTWSDLILAWFLNTTQTIFYFRTNSLSLGYQHNCSHAKHTSWSTKKKVWEWNFFDRKLDQVDDRAHRLCVWGGGGWGMANRFQNNSRKLGRKVGQILQKDFVGDLCLSQIFDSVRRSHDCPSLHKEHYLIPPVTFRRHRPLTGGQYSIPIPP